MRLAVSDLACSSLAYSSLALPCVCHFQSMSLCMQSVLSIPGSWVHHVATFWLWLGRGPFGGPDDSEFHESLSYRHGNAVKNEVWTSPWCRTLCSHVRFLVHVSITPFFAWFWGKICSQGCNPLGHGETKSGKNDRKNTGFWKHADQNDRKDTGFCTGAVSKPRFFSCFHTARWTVA